MERAWTTLLTFMGFKKLTDFAVKLFRKKMFNQNVNGKVFTELTYTYCISQPN